jgi:RNase adapter protein RapZ
VSPLKEYPLSQPRTIVIVTGLAGAGKRTALDTFEDAGFYCVDNMPASLAAHFLEHADRSGPIAGWAFVMDLRDPRFLNEIDPLCQKLTNGGFRVQIVFLEANEQTLLRRYTQTRRHHPLARGGSLVEAVRGEKKQLHHVRNRADHIIDTSHLSIHELKFAVLSIAQKHTAISGMAINIVSFGFKYDTPPGVDMILDVRFLSNPFFVPELKDLDGESKEIQAYVGKDPNMAPFLEKYLDILDFLIPLYQKEGKAYLTLAVGCTGGRHRSVVVAKRIYDHVSRKQPTVRLIHRDIRNK